MKRHARSLRPLTNAEQRLLPKYSIGIVSKLVGMPPQMLRRYEEAGLVEPARQDGKNRLYSDHDVAILHEVAELAEQGVNSVGIRYILQLRQQVQILQLETRQIRSTQPHPDEGEPKRSSGL
ncbi:MerR family transcriptional regulator [Ktedonosporobacter rubrisoli]|uniref:MerR family transcriptional regulator n=1 Tax=Ktedonosporobacter rubrisoli TaxID=2509675 RepID=A0A4P6JS12_KTERU|nr:MerR family transcriptional regulator [Ktedonosporobacter rubrisoli]QBD77606.1 MerR family transcriptional regulator [Ktedonosporobacter rubrisoli]